MTVTRRNGSRYSSRITDSEIATDPMAQPAAVASSLVRVRPEVAVSVTGNAEARRQHARRPQPFRCLGQKPCPCPKTHRPINESYGVGEKTRPLVQDITDPQRDCPRCGYRPTEQTD